jgi:arsenic resistance protein ArsH
MKIVIINGALEGRTGQELSKYFEQRCKTIGMDTAIFSVATAEVPPFTMQGEQVPAAVTNMISLFQQADLHVWLAPLYHGSIPGMMKNCLDWLELSRQCPTPYLTDKLIGMVCWADGQHALNGIHTMDTVAKSLRAWTLPFTIPIIKNQLYDEAPPHHFSLFYKNKFDQMILLLQQAIQKFNKDIVTDSVTL